MRLRQRLRREFIVAGDRFAYPVVIARGSDTSPPILRSHSAALKRSGPWLAVGSAARQRRWDASVTARLTFGLGVLF